MEKRIELNYDQASALQQLLSDYDLDVEVEIYNDGDNDDGDLDEGGSDGEVIPTKLTTKELEKAVVRNNKVVVKIDQVVMNDLPDIIEEFKEARYWYKEFNESVISMLGDGDGALLLALIAFFSARNSLQPNIKEAVRMYTYFKDDYAKSPEDVFDFINTMDEFKEILRQEKAKSKDKTGFGLKFRMNKVVKDRSKGKTSDIGSKILKYEHLKIFNFLLKDLALVNHWLMVSKLFRYYIKRNGRINTKNLVDLLLKSLDKSGDIIDGEDNITSGYKIFNFALNLLDPQLKINKFEHKWFPVTIDSWMIFFFYPHWRDMKDKDEKKKNVGGVFKSRYKYVYLAMKINELSKEVGMTPNELQAVIWVSMLKKHRPNSAKDLSGSLDRILEDFESKNNASESMVQLVKQWKSKIS